MQRNVEQIRKYSNSKLANTASHTFYVVQQNNNRPIFYSRISNIDKGGTIPFNQNSNIKINVNHPVQNIAQYNTPMRANSQLRVFPNTKKVYFTYVDPRSLLVEKRYIQTIVHSSEKPYTSQWEQRYFQLQKQMIFFMQIHERMTEEFLKIKQQFKSHSQVVLRNSMQTLSKSYAVGVAGTNQQQKKYKYEQIDQQNKKLKQKISNMQQTIQNLQNQLLKQKNLTYKTQTQKTQAILQFKQYQFSVKQLISQKTKSENQIYDIKLILADKNLQIQKLMAFIEELKEQIAIQAQKHRLRQIQMQEQMENLRQKPKLSKKNISSDKNSPQKFQERLTRVRLEYEKKQRKLQKQAQLKQKQISQLRKYIVQLQEQQRVSKQFKQNYEKMYNEKKQQINSLKMMQQTLMSSEKDQKQILIYEQRISQLLKLAKQQSQKISSLQSAKTELLKKMDQYQDNYVSQQQLTYLHSLIQKNKNQILEQGGVNYDELNNKAKAYYNGKIFEQKMIYELKKDNEKLRELVKKIDLKQLIKQSVIINSNIIINNNVQSGSQISMSMKNMISDLFFKLDRVLEGAKYNTMNLKSERIINSNASISPPKTKRSSKTSKNQQKIELLQNSNNLKISNDLQMLKIYIVNLSSTCDRLVKQLQRERSTIDGMQTKKHQQILRMISSISNNVNTNEEDFYKTKNKQMQNQIGQLISLSKDLKQRLGQKHMQISGTQYWKNQLKMQKQLTSQLQSRYNKLLQEYQKLNNTQKQASQKLELFVIQHEKIVQHNITTQNKLSLLHNVSQQLKLIHVQKSQWQRQETIFNAKIHDYESIINSKQKQISGLTLRIDSYNKSKIHLQSAIMQKNNAMESLNRNISRIQQQLNLLRHQNEQKQKYAVNNQNQLIRVQNQLNTCIKNKKQQESLINQYKKKIEQYKVQKSIFLQNEKVKHYNYQSQIFSTHQKHNFQLRKNVQNEELIKSLKLKITKLTDEISLLKKAQLNVKQVSQQQINYNINIYTLQLLRSQIIACQSLTHEINIIKQIRNQQIIKQLQQVFNNMLKSISEMMKNDSISTQNYIKYKYQQNTGRKDNKKQQNLNSYKIQLIRSIFIQLDCLIVQIQTKQQRNRNICHQVQKQIQIGLQNISTLDIL